LPNLRKLSITYPFDTFMLPSSIKKIFCGNNNTFQE